MKQPQYRTIFTKDIKRAKKRGKDLNKLADIAHQLINGKTLAAKHRDHALVGNYKHHRECHIEPDWLLIYKLEENHIIFERTGSHADLFKCELRAKN